MSVQIRAEFMSYGSASPGVCWLCNQSRRPADVVVDLDKSIDMEGNVQVCSTCVTHLASEIGMLSVKDADRIKGQTAAANARAKEAETKLAAMREYLAEAAR